MTTSPRPTAEQELRMIKDSLRQLHKRAANLEKLFLSTAGSDIEKLKNAARLYARLYSDLDITLEHILGVDD